jgi:protein tyrosine phosphatase
MSNKGKRNHRGKVQALETMRIDYNKANRKPIDKARYEIWPDRCNPGEYRIIDLLNNNQCVSSNHETRESAQAWIDEQ